MEIGGLIDGLIRKSNDLRKPDDYIRDGLVYCGKCHTPKQCRVEILGVMQTPMCMCKCMKAEYDREQEELRRKERQQRIERNRNVGFPDAEMMNWTFDRDDRTNQKPSDVCRRYCEAFREMFSKGKGLLLFGTVGTGKTFLAACVANRLIDDGYTCMVTNFSRLTNRLTGSFEGRQEFLDSLNQYDLLVIDDLASERNTEFMNEIVFSIIDSRYRSGKPLIVTTNLSADELKYPKDLSKQRVFSRLFEMCFPIEVKGQDRRKQKMIDDHAEMKGLLGL